MVMVSIALVMAVIVTNIYAKKDVPERCPGWSVRLAAKFYPAHFLPSHREHHRHAASGVYCKYSGRNGPLPAIRERRPLERLATVESATVDVDGGAACDDDCETTLCDCCGRFVCRDTSTKCDVVSDVTAGRTRCVDVIVVDRCRGDESVRPQRQQQQQCVVSDERRYSRCPRGDSGATAAAPVTLDSFDFRRSEAEWRMVAKFTDRVFFWVFLAMSLFTQMNLFLQMVPETRGDVG